MLTPRTAIPIEVIITVTDVGEAPKVSGMAEPTFMESEGDITMPLATYMGMDPDVDAAATLTWSVRRRRQQVQHQRRWSAQVQGRARLRGSDGREQNNVYEVTVRAADGDGNRDEMAVKVTVANVEEDGVVSLSRTQIRVGVPVTASLSDPDGSISGSPGSGTTAPSVRTTSQETPLKTPTLPPIRRLRTTLAIS